MKTKKPVSETTFKRRVQEDLKKLPNVYFVKIQQRTIRGVPDIFACIDGRMVALELKRDEHARIAPLQTATLARIDRAGGHAVIAYPENWEDVYTYLKEMAGV